MVTEHTQPVFRDETSIAAICPACEGSGYRVSNYCGFCGGSGGVPIAIADAMVARQRAALVSA